MRADGLELRRAPLLHLGRQRRSRGAQRADAGEVAIVGQRDARLHAVGKKRRARAEEGHARIGRKTPQHAPVGVVLAAAGVAVVDHAGGARQQAAELRVPHHPAGGAVPVVALAKAVGLVAAADVVVQHLELQRHQHRTAVAVHDGLGQAGGAAGVDDPQRVVKRQPHGLESHRFSVISGGSASPACPSSYRNRSIQIAEQHRVLHAGQVLAQLGQHGAAVVVAAAVGHAVHTDQHLGLDLPKAVEHRVRAHVGRADAPHTTDAHRGQKGDHGLGHVGQVGGHAVAGLDALGLEVQRQRRHLAAQLGPAQLAVLALFVAADDGGQACGVGGIHMPQRLACVVDLGARKPHRAGHGVLGEHGGVGRGRLQIKVVPHALPEGVEFGGGPAPQRVVAVELQAALVAQPVLVQADLGDVRRGCVCCLHGDAAYQRAHPLTMLARLQIDSVPALDCGISRGRGGVLHKIAASPSLRAASLLPDGRLFWRIRPQVTRLAAPPLRASAWRRPYPGHPGVRGLPGPRLAASGLLFFVMCFAHSCLPRWLRVVAHQAAQEAAFRRLWPTESAGFCRWYSTARRCLISARQHILC